LETVSFNHAIIIFFKCNLLLSDVESKSHMTRHCIRTKEELECSSDRRENTMYLAQCCS